MKSNDTLPCLALPYSWALLYEEGVLKGRNALNRTLGLEEVHSLPHPLQCWVPFCCMLFNSTVWDGFPHTTPPSQRLTHSTWTACRGNSATVVLP